MRKIRNLLSIAFLLLAICFISSDALARDGTYQFSDDSIDVQTSENVQTVKAVKTEIQYKFDDKILHPKIRFNIEPTQKTDNYKFLYVDQIQNIPINEKITFDRVTAKSRESPKSRS